MKNVNDTVMKLTRAWNIAKMMECPLTYTFSNKIIPTTYDDFNRTIYGYKRTESNLENIIIVVYSSFEYMTDIADCFTSVYFYHDPYIVSKGKAFDMFDKFPCITDVLFKTKTKYIQSLYLHMDNVDDIVKFNNTNTLNLYAKFLFDENSLCKYLIMPRVQQTTDFKDIYKLNKYKDELEKIANGTFSEVHFCIPYTVMKSNRYCVFSYDRDQAYEFKRYLSKHSTSQSDVERYTFTGN